MEIIVEDRREEPAPTCPPPRLSRAARLVVVSWAVLAAPALCRAQAPASAPWGPAETVEGCQLSTRPVPGRAYVAARATCAVAAELETLTAVLRDIDRYPRWMHNCSQTKILKVVDRERDGYVFWFRQRVAMLTDRDMVLRTEVPVREQDRWVIRATSTSEVPYDAGQGFVRMPSFASEWVLERIGPRRTLVTFTVEPDLGPGLPAALANDAIARLPLRFIRQGLERTAARIDEARGRLASRSTGGGAPLAP